MLQMYMNVPNVPEEAVKDYARHLLRLCGVARIVEPGHWWFEHQMGRFQAAYRELLKSMVKQRSDRGEVLRAAKRYALQFHADGLASADVYRDAMGILARGLQWS